MSKIQVGYGSDTRPKNPKNSYGKRSSGKKVLNGGFSGEPYTSFAGISEEKWESIFGEAGKPWWERRDNNK